MKTKDKKKRIRYSYLFEKVNPTTGVKDYIAIVVPKDRRGCPVNLMVKIASSPAVTKKSKSRK